MRPGGAGRQEEGRDDRGLQGQARGADQEARRRAHCHRFLGPGHPMRQGPPRGPGRQHGAIAAAGGLG